MSQIPPLTIRGNARNNYLYGTAISDGINAGLGDDYLRGYAGNDYLWGGAGSDRFVFERTQTQNGRDTIKDYMYAPTASGGEVDVLDFSLVGFARNALSRNSGIEDGIDNVIRFMDDGEGGARVEVSITGAGGETFTQWATLEGLYAGNLVHFRIGAHTFTRPVQGAPSTGLRYDIGNGDRNGDGTISDGEDDHPNDFADNDDLFDDRLIVDGGGDNDTIHMGAEVLMGDRVLGFGGTTAFTPGVTALSVPESVVWSGEGDAVLNGEFQVYYGTYDAATDIFTVTSTPGTTADPTSATHTMVLYDSDGDTKGGQVNALGGKVLQGVYAESQWYIEEGALQYDTNPTRWNDLDSKSGDDVLNTENVLYGTGANEAFDAGAGIDIIYAGAGNDRLFGGSSYYDSYYDGPGPWTIEDGNDWLYGGAGADIFFATNVLDGGIDSIKDFKGAEGDVIALALGTGPIEQALWSESSNPLSPEDAGGRWLSWSEILEAYPNGVGYDPSLVVTLTGDTLEAALQAATSVPGAVFTTQETPVNLYVLQHGGKEYLYLDALGNGYPAEYVPMADFIVEITGAVGLNASNIYLYAGPPV